MRGLDRGEVYTTGAALRVAAAPWAVLEEWDALSADDAGVNPTAFSPTSRQALVTGLREVCRTDWFSVAVRVASSSCFSELQRWVNGEPVSAPLERSLVGYLLRATSRATPFGTFAGCGFLPLGPSTILTMAEPALQRHSRLDYRVQLAVADRTAIELGDQVRVYPNDLLWVAGGRARYAVRTSAKDGGTSIDGTDSRQTQWQLRTTMASPPVCLVLRLARSGPTVAELCAAVVTNLKAEGVIADGDQAHALVNEMVDGQLLRPVTGPNPVGAGDRPGRVAADVPMAPLTVHLQERAAAALAAADEAPIGELPYRLDLIEGLLGGVDPADHRSVSAPSVQIDATVAAGNLSLGRRLAEEIVRDVIALLPLDPDSVEPPPSLVEFRTRFQDRYDTAEVPLLQAIDPDLGIGYGAQPRPAAHLSPFVHDLPSPRSEAPSSFGTVDRWRLRLLTDALRAGKQEVHIGAVELDDLRPRWTEPPPSFAVFGTLSAGSAAQADEGDYRFVLKGIDVCTGAAMLTRFAIHDERLAGLVRDQVKAEQAAHPDCAYVEIVHVPQAGAGNVASRPRLRDYELPIGQSYRPAAGRLVSADEIWVSVVGDRIVLRSARLGREVRPRITSAHDFHAQGLAVYRLLGDLQSQERGWGQGWTWGPLAAASFLPRVTCGRLVLSRARWRLTPEDTAPLRAAVTDSVRLSAVQTLRERYDIPGRVVLADGDQELAINLANVLALDVLVARMRPDKPINLMELLPQPDQLCVTNASGQGVVHELVITGASRSPRVDSWRAPRRAGVIEGRAYPPGSAWIYLRLYGPISTADELISGPLAELTADSRARGAIDEWHFIRYDDGQPHLRVRWHAADGYEAEVLYRHLSGVAKAIELGLLQGVEVGTYRPELARFDGPAGLAIAERLFTADSDFAVAVAGMRTTVTTADRLAELRITAALLGVDRLLDDLGVDGAGRLTWATKWSDALRGSDGDGAARLHASALSYRKRQRVLSTLLAEPPIDLAVLCERRSERIAGLLGGVPASVRANLVQQAPIFVHLHLNRLTPAAEPLVDLVVADWLARMYRTQRARRAQR